MSFSPRFQEAIDAAPESPLIEDRWDWFDQLRAAAQSPVEKAWVRLEHAFSTWATVHDTTERLLGDPDWWKKP